MKTKIEDLRILVVGDIMLDKYVNGKVTRISPEAPVPVVNVTEEYHTLGGCGNVVRNLRELGASVDCLSSIGNDIYGNYITTELENIGVRSLLFNGSKQTTVKERIIANEQKVQMLRIDRETTDTIEPQYAIDVLKSKCRDIYDMVVVSDYNKGMISKQLMDFLFTHQNADIIVDPKPDHANMYDGAFIITPNEKEWNEMQYFKGMLKNVKFILETKGSKGMNLINNMNNTNELITSKKLPIYNVSGCGDVVVAVLTVCLSVGIDPLKSAKISNACAGYTATLPGTSIITKDKFNEFLDLI